MSPVFQNLVNNNSLMYAKTHTTPKFESPLHWHTEYELILCKKVSGTAYIGNYTESFVEGDVFLIGSNVPHCFNKTYEKQNASAVVIHFNKKILENVADGYVPIDNLLSKSMCGIKIKEKKDIQYLGEFIEKINKSKGLREFINLFECLDYITKIKNLSTLTSEPLIDINNSNSNRIKLVYDYTINSFQNKITLADVAKKVKMSVPAFCKFFKQTTQKTYVQYLNETRIENACKLLHDTEMSVSEIALNCGYNTHVNFHKQFLKVKNIQPFAYRQKYLKIFKF